MGLPIMGMVERNRSVSRDRNFRLLLLVLSIRLIFFQTIEPAEAVVRIAGCRIDTDWVQIQQRYRRGGDITH